MVNFVPRLSPMYTYVLMYCVVFDPYKIGGEPGRFYPMNDVRMRDLLNVCGWCWCFPANASSCTPPQTRVWVKNNAKRHQCSSLSMERVSIKAVTTNMEEEAAISMYWKAYSVLWPDCKGNVYAAALSRPSTLLQSYTQQVNTLLVSLSVYSQPWDMAGGETGLHTRTDACGKQQSHPHSIQVSPLSLYTCHITHMTKSLRLSRPKFVRSKVV